MPVDPDCDTGDCGDEPPDADPGCCGALTCEENETCCNNTTCVLTSSFQTDTNNCGGCDIVCDPGETCVDGVCVGDGIGCCIMTVCNCDYSFTPTLCTTDGPNNTFTPGTSASCDELPFPPGFVCNDNNDGMFSVTFTEEACREGCCRRYECDGSNGYVLVSSTASSANCTYNSTSPPPCPNYGHYTTWSEGPCPGCCYNYICDGEGMLTFTGKSPTSSSACEDSYCYYNCYGDLACRGQTSNLYYPEETCPSALGAPLNKEIVVSDTPCVDGECEEHVATWMAEPVGEPNEKGLYKVKWILLDDCPGACCSDQPTQPEFVKSSTLVDAPCKCGCS